MTFLVGLLLTLCNLILLDHLGKEFYEKFNDWLQTKKLISSHPEMQGVNVGEEDLIYFKADKEIRDLVMENNEPGATEPFLGDLFLLEEDGF